MPSSSTFLNHHLPLAVAAARKNRVIALLAKDDDESEEILTNNGIAVRYISLSRKSCNPSRILIEAIALRQILVHLSPDVVNAINLKAVFVAALAGIGCSWHTVGTIPGLGYMFTGRSLRQLFLRSATARGLAFALSRQRHTLIMSNPDDASEFINRGVSSSEHIRIVPVPGVNLKMFFPAPEPSDGFRVLLAARMLWSKGVGDFVAAARTLKTIMQDADFVLAGMPDPGNPDSVNVETLENWKNEGVIRWVGLCDDMPKLITSCHVVCLPTWYREGFPRVLVEAMACGRVIITTDVPGCREVFAHGECGVKIPPKNPSALIEALIWLHSNPNARRAMGTDGACVVKENFAEEIITRAALNCYSK